MLLAVRQDFEPANQTEGASALYWDPQTLKGYEQYPYFQQRVDSLKQRFAPTGQKTLIVGSGWGYLVNLAVTAGYDCYGLDASSYAVDKAKALYPTLAARFVLGDALSATGMNAVSTAAGLHGNPPRFDLLVTEDFLECLTDAEIATALPLLRARCRTNLLHILTELDPWGQAHGARQDVNWKTRAQWLALLSPPDICVGPSGDLW